MTSRFITYPDLVESVDNHPVLLIDADQYAIEDIGLFCKMSNTNFDIYLYRNETEDLQWLSQAHNRVKTTLLKENSKVSITPEDNLIKFGPESQLKNPLTYFQNYTNQGETQ
jgi:hypothetical protein